MMPPPKAGKHRRDRRANLTRVRGIPDSRHPSPTRLLITAGPTQEPIDAVRYLANRSSGRLGVALADHAASRGHNVTLLLGPTALVPEDTSIDLVRFQTTADLQEALEQRADRCDILIMAAAVSDYRPADPAGAGAKLERKGKDLFLRLEPTPDLLAMLGQRKRPEQTFVGFALEEPERLLERAREKLVRKGLDLIVANPLETMDAGEIRAALLSPAGLVDETGEAMPKHRFAEWLLKRIEQVHRNQVI